MKKIILIISVFVSTNILATTPTEEGLLRNLNNPNIPGNMVTIKAAITKSSDQSKTENTRTDYYKFVFMLDGTISLLQSNYSGSQMLANQLQDLKYIPDLVSEIKKEKIAEKGMFYAIMAMLATNRPNPMEAFLEKTGAVVVKNKELINVEKMKLLYAYKNYLVSSRGKSDVASPLSPSDPKEKEKAVDLFKSNTFTRSKNVELIKEGDEFLWKVDWKNVKAYFTNEEKRLKTMDYVLNDTTTQVEVSDYTMFNNNNEFPRLITVKDTGGELYKIQILLQEVKKSADKKLLDKIDESKKAMQKPLAPADVFSFLF